MKTSTRLIAFALAMATAAPVAARDQTRLERVAERAERQAADEPAVDAEGEPRPCEGRQRHRSLATHPATPCQQQPGFLELVDNQLILHKARKSS